MAEYKHTIDDELDWSLLDQLHGVVLQIGSFCFRTKQICLTVLFVVVGVIATFTSKKLDVSIFVAGVLIPACFWFLDSVAYYYQVKLRGVMDGIRDRIHERHSKIILRGPNSEVIANSRTIRSVNQRLRDAFFNHSMWIYYVLITTDIMLWFSFSSGYIQ